jgi:hypothetical protein
LDFIKRTEDHQLMAREAEGSNYSSSSNRDSLRVCQEKNLELKTTKLNVYQPRQPAKTSIHRVSSQFPSRQIDHQHTHAHTRTPACGFASYRKQNVIPLVTMAPKIYNIPSDEEELKKMITQPLLIDECQQTDDALVKPNKVLRDDDDDDDAAPSCSHSKFVVLGVLTGFFIQVVSLGAYALLLIHYNKYLQKEGVSELDLMTVWASTNEEWKNMVNVDWFIYGILSILTQIDLVIYVLIWIAFTCTMTKNGMQFLRFQYQNPALKRRFIFVLGVYFLVGIVLGAFCAWSMIDVYLGFPIPFLPIVATVGIDLILCYMMVWCYDLGRKSTAAAVVEDCEDEDDEEEEECICC